MLRLPELLNWFLKPFCGENKSANELNLLDMPDVVMKNILDYCTWPDYFALRRVCRNIRNYIDAVRPKGDFSAIRVTVYPKQIELNLTTHVKEDGLNYSESFDINYEQKYEKCAIKYTKKYSTIGYYEEENVDFVDCFLTDFKFLLKNQKSLLQTLMFEIEIEFDPDEKHLEILKNQLEIEVESIAKKIMDTVNDVMRLRKEKLLVKSLLSNLLEHQTIEILSFINPNSLKKLWITDRTNFIVRSNLGSHKLEIDEIMKMEHWKSLEEFRGFGNVATVPKETFSHLKKFEICFERVTVDDVLYWKEIIESRFNQKFSSFNFVDEKSQKELIRNLCQQFPNYVIGDMYLKFPTIYEDIFVMIRGVDPIKQIDIYLDF